MRMPKKKQRNLDLSLAPLIDCMFILLIFFLVSTTMKKIEKEIPLELPRSEIGVERPEADNVVVLSIDQKGQKYFRAEPVTTGVLLDRLANLPPGSRIRLDADVETRYREIVEVIEAAQFQGFRDIGLKIKTRPDRNYD